MTGAQSAEVREGVGSRIHAHLARLGGVELELPDRTCLQQAPNFGEAAE